MYTNWLAAQACAILNHTVVRPLRQTADGSLRWPMKTLIIKDDARCAMREEEDPAAMSEPDHNRRSRTETFHMRMSADEKRRLEERARQWGKDNGYATNDSGMMSRYARDVLLGPRKEDQALTHADLIGFKFRLRESQISMVRVGTLINQIARVANSTGHIMSAELRESLVQMRREIDRIEDTITDVWNRNR